ncbi:MAG TPA: hypothetical protein VMU13_00240 [Candidatus Paceibacterota bacterium]|nr:hypothetical protein [Candidatus Paceibacterota bacterium]
MEPTRDNRNTIIATTILVAVVLCGIAYFMSHQSDLAGPAQGTTTESATTSVNTITSTSSGATISITSASSSSGYKIQLIPSGTAPVAPNYKAPLVFSDPTITTDEHSSMQTQFAHVEATLSVSSKDFNSWIALGNLRKEAGDYNGAAADWQYALALYPSNVISNANLADLYTNYLHDYPKAAAAYKAAIANNPTQVYLYQDLAQLYSSQYPQSTTTIVALLKQGIAANPAASELKATLAKYQ